MQTNYALQVYMYVELLPTLLCPYLVNETLY